MKSPIVFVMFLIIIIIIIIIIILLSTPNFSKTKGRMTTKF